MARKLYKQTLSFQARVQQEFLKALGEPLSVLHSLISNDKECRTSQAIETVLRWVVLFEGTTRIGISWQVGDKERGILGLQGLLAAGCRTRIRAGKRAKKNNTAAISGEVPKDDDVVDNGGGQMERGFETIQKVIECYIIDDMCHAFEENPCGDLYERGTQLDEDLWVGRDYILTLAKATEKSVLFRHLSPIPVMAFVLYVAGVISGALHVASNGNVWDIEVIHSFTRTFCSQACIPRTRAVLWGLHDDIDGTQEFSKMLRTFSSHDVSILRVSVGATIVNALISVLQNSLSSTACCAFTEFQDVVSKTASGQPRSNLLRSFKTKLHRGEWNHPYSTEVNTPDGTNHLRDGIEILRVSLQTEVLPQFGIVRRSKFVHRVNSDDFNEMVSNRSDMKEVNNRLRTDVKRLGEFVQGSSESSTSQESKDMLRGKPDSFILRDVDDLMSTFESLIVFSFQLAEEFLELYERKDVVSFEAYTTDTIRMTVLGAAASDLPGLVASLYEDYMCNEVVSAFNEESGARSFRTSKNAGRRDRSPKDNDGRTRTARMKKAFSAGP